MKPTLFRLSPAVVLAVAGGSSIALTPAYAQEHEGEIEGVVRDAETGEPLAGSFVSVVGTGTAAVTHGDGTFHLNGIEDGSYAIHADRLGYRGATIEVTVEEESAVVVIELVASPIALQGMVVTATISETQRGRSAAPGKRHGRR